MRQRQEVAVSPRELLKAVLEAVLEPHQRIVRALRQLAAAASSPWPRAACSRYIAMVGTRVRDRMKEAIMANTTAIAIGTNRKPATPSSANIGTKTMQMQSSETKAGLHDLARRRP